MDRRLALIEEAWADDCRYVCYSTDVSGYGEITWAMLDPAGSATISGVDCALFAEDGRAG
jgi:hypothetical protein